MKVIIKLREGAQVPEGAKFLYAQKEPDTKNSYEQWRQSEGIMGIIPIFSTETLYRVTPVVTFFYYEIEAKEK